MFQRYLQSRKEQCFYLFICRIGRIKFFAVLSEEEIKKYKVNRKESLAEVGVREEQKEYRAKYQGYINSAEAKQERVLIRYLKSVKQLKKARNGLAEMSESSEQKEADTNEL